MFFHHAFNCNGIDTFESVNYILSKLQIGTNSFSSMESKHLYGMI